MLVPLDLSHYHARGVNKKGGDLCFDNEDNDSLPLFQA